MFVSPDPPRNFEARSSMVRVSLRYSYPVALQSRMSGTTVLSLVPDGLCGALSLIGHCIGAHGKGQSKGGSYANNRL